MYRTYPESSEASPTQDLTALENVIRHHKFVLIALRSRKHNVDLAAFLRPEYAILFYAATEQDNSLDQYITHLAEAFHEADARFNNRAQGSSAAERAQKLAKDINKIRPRFVVLDEIDRLNQPEGDLSDELFEFLHALGEALADDTTLVISARELNYQHWQPLLSSGEAVLLDDLSGKQPTSTCCPQVEVYGFGGGAVYSDGIPVTIWDGPLPRNLFYFFTDHPLITRGDIFSTFWPELPVKEATNVYHVTKRKVTERVGYETMIYSGGFYRAAPKVNVYYDVALFEAAIEEGRRNPDNIEAWQRAIHLYRQPFLYRLHMPWMIARRQKLAQDYTEALIEMARHYRRSDVGQSISYYLRALREVPHREDIHRDVMKLYAEQGQMDRVKAQFNTLENELKRAFNITPGKATREFYSSLTEKRR